MRDHREGQDPSIKVDITEQIRALADSIERRPPVVRRRPRPRGVTSTITKRTTPGRTTAAARLLRSQR
jgi:hypothetical protein